MDDGWLPLYRKILDNEVFKHDLRAWHVFEVLMVICDKETGSWKGGRKKLARLCDMNENTLYNVQTRLKRQGMITASSTAKYTTYNICNWTKYSLAVNKQINKQINKSSTSNQHYNNKIPTNVGIRNKKVSNTNVLLGAKVQKPDDLISKLFYDAVKALELPVTNHNVLRTKITAMKREASEEDLVLYLEFMRDKFARTRIEFKPAVNSALDIYTKRVAIINAFKKAVEDQQTRVWKPAAA